MYYSSGNYEAFARPKKPADVDNKHAYIIGTGLAALSAACYLVRHGQTSWNIEGRAQGHSDIELDEVGMRQARLLC